MKAIVYTSNTGYTKKYAELLAENTGLSVYDSKSVPENLRGADIVYLGWMMAGKVSGYSNAARKYNVKICCGVGMADADQKQLSDMIKNNNIPGDCVSFILQGGFDINKLKGIYKFMMKMMSKGVGSKLEAKPDRTPEEDKMLDMMKNGGDYVCESSLAPVIEAVKRII